MIGIEKILDYINAEANAECEEISRNAAAECSRIRSDYSRLEQDEYWKSINAGSKETEQRHEQLKNLAAMEAKKMLLSTQQEMVDEAFILAAKKLSELPKREYSKLCSRLAVSPNFSAEAIVEQYRAELSLKIVSVLFD